MKDPIKCIIVDDEEGAHVVITHHLRSISAFELKASFYNAVEAMDYIFNNPVDLIFLDINMPGLSGLEMLAAMPAAPLVILTTAYSEHALESYQYGVVDYLVKPIELSRFMSALNKVVMRLRPVNTMSSVVGASEPGSLVLKVDGGLVKLSFENILYVTSWGNYVKLYTTEKMYLSPITTSEIEQKLPRPAFVRIHKSHIVAINQVQKIEGGHAHLKNGAVLPIGNTYRRELLELFR